MRKRKKVLIVVGLALAAILVLLLWPGEPEPRYQGRTLSEWLGRYRQGGNQRPEAFEALRNMGTNALPTLLRWISYDPAQFRETVVTLARKLPGSLGLSAPERRAADAERAFGILGREALPAAPELARLAETSRGRRRPVTCVRALGSLGPGALPAMISILTNTSGMARYYVIAYIPTAGTNAWRAVPALIECLKDPAVAIQAAGALGRLPGRPTNAVPALTAMLQNPTPNYSAAAAFALAAVGPSARSAVPELLTMLNSSSPEASSAASVALRQIAPEVLTNAAPQ